MNIFYISTGCPYNSLGIGTIQNDPNLIRFIREKVAARQKENKLAINKVITSEKSQGFAGCKDLGFQMLIMSVPLEVINSVDLMLVVEMEVMEEYD